MYIPKFNCEEGRGVLERLMKDHSLTVAITVDDVGIPIATPMPLVLDGNRGELGTVTSTCTGRCREVGAPRIEISTVHGTSPPSLRHPVRHTG